jgi:hypothetical protein
MYFGRSSTPPGHLTFSLSNYENNSPDSDIFTESLAERAEFPWTDALSSQICSNSDFHNATNHTSGHPGATARLLHSVKSAALAKPVERLLTHETLSVL